MRWAVYYYVRDCRAWCKPRIRHYLPITVEGRTKSEALRAVEELDGGESGYKLFVTREVNVRLEFSA